MRFLPDPPSDARARTEQRWWRWLLLAAAAVAVLCTLAPWVRVQFDRLFGTHAGPPGWQTSAGFTCFCASLLVAMLALAETGTATSARAARPACAVLAGLSTLLLAAEWWSGPGWLRGVTATWTAAFYLLLLCAPILFVVCALRWAAIAVDATRWPTAGGGQSSSGPPT